MSSVKGQCASRGTNIPAILCDVTINHTKIAAEENKTVNIFFILPNITFTMESVTSSARDRSAEIDRCLSMIVPSASDEMKFVGMLILPKLLEQNNLQDIERVFKGMNFKFIERLLRTSECQFRHDKH